MIALSGPHRTGKTTLAKAWSDKFGWHFIPSQSTPAFKALGHSYHDTLTVPQRMDVQELILDNAVADYRKAKGSWISDRSPLDMACYVMAELAQMPEASEHADRILAYVERCFTETNRYCPVVVLVQPGIPYVEEADKPRANLVAQEQFNLILWGLARDNRLKVRSAYLPRGNSTVEERIDILANLHNRFLALTVEQIPDDAPALH